MFADVLSRLFPSRRNEAAVRTAGQRRSAVDAAVAWWVDALRGREGVGDDALTSFARDLHADLSARLEQTYRVYLEVSFQPKGSLRTAALASGVSIDAFPQGATMSVSDTKVEVSKSAHEPYVALLGAA